MTILLCSILLGLQKHCEFRWLLTWQILLIKEREVVGDGQEKYEQRGSATKSDMTQEFFPLSFSVLPMFPLLLVAEFTPTPSPHPGFITAKSSQLIPQIKM